MKAFITRFSLILILGLTALVSKAEMVTVTIDLIKYELNEETSTAEVTGYIDGITKADIKSSVTYSEKDYTVTEIGGIAFYNCSALTEVTIPNSVTIIGHSAFRGCTNMTSLAIGNSVTEIGGNAFYDCSALTEVIIPNSVTIIDDSAFRGCTSMTSLTIGNSVTEIGPSAFYQCRALTELTIPNSITKIGDSAFGGCTSMTSLTIGNSVTEIGPSAFVYCRALTELTIPNSVTIIGSQAFGSCESMTSLTIGNSVTEIGRLAFQGCSALTELTIPNSVISIGERAFFNCKSMTSLTIGNSVTEIRESAFCWCSNLTEVYYDAENPIEGGYDIFRNGYDATLYVPEAAIEKCKAIEPWRNFKNIAALKISAESVKIDKETVELKVGETATLTATVMPENATDKTVTWSSSNPEVATVNADGMITAIAVGEAVITASCGEVSAECKVTVNPVAAESVVLDKETLELKVGDTATLTATVLPDNTTDKTVTWSSSNESVATVNADGVITAIAVGEAVITATCGEVAAECKVTVNPVAAESVKLDKETLELKVGETATLTATVMPENATDKTVTWKSSDESVATVNADGDITAIAVGEAVITATCSEATAECRVTVTAESGIEAAEANEPIITLSPMTINVSGVDDDCEVSIYTVAGQLIASERGNCSVAVANRGIYLVKVGTRVEKVSVTR